MDYREIGNTGVQVSEIGFGTGDNGGLMVRGSRSEQLAAVSRALELGINYFDTSPAYGNGISETNLGNILQELKEHPVIATKVEIMPEHLPDIASRVVASVDASLRRLRCDTIDIVMIHNPIHLKREVDVSHYPPPMHVWIRLGIDEDVLSIRGAMEGLESLRTAGKVRMAGFTVDSLDIGAVDKLMDQGGIDHINAFHNLLNPTAAIVKPEGLIVDYDFCQVIQHAADRNVGIAAVGPHAGWALTDHAINGGGRHPIATARHTSDQDVGDDEFHRQQDDPRVTKAKAFAFLSRGGEQSLSQASVRYALSTPGVKSVVGGFSEIAHIEEMAGAVRLGPLSPEDMAGIEEVWRNNFWLP